MLINPTLLQHCHKFSSKPPCIKFEHFFVYTAQKLMFSIIYVYAAERHIFSFSTQFSNQIRLSESSIPQKRASYRC